MLRELSENFSESDDRRPEHYRWRAFLKILRSRPLSHEAFSRLFSVIAVDPDPSLRESMAIALLSLPECPASLALPAGLDPERLRDLAERRKARELRTKLAPEGRSWTLLGGDIWRDGGSLSAVLSFGRGAVSLWLQVLAREDPRHEVAHGQLFLSNGTDPTILQFLLSPAEEPGWSLALAAAARESKDSLAAGHARSMAAVLQKRAG
jgi:hypothetical protein